MARCRLCFLITSHVNLQRQARGEMLTPYHSRAILWTESCHRRRLCFLITSHVNLQRQVSGEMLTPDHSSVILWTESLHLFLFRLKSYVTHTFHKSAELSKKRVQRDLSMGCTGSTFSSAITVTAAAAAAAAATAAHTCQTCQYMPLSNRLLAVRVLNPVPPKPMLDGHKGSCQRLATPK